MTLFIKYKIVLYLAAFISGILLKTYLNPGIFITTVVFVPCLILIYKKTALSFLVLIPLGIFLTSNYEPDRNIEHLTGKKVDITCVLKNIPEVRKNSTRLFVQTIKIKYGKKEYEVNENLILYFGELGKSLHYGDQILVRNTRLEKIKNFKNPGSFDLKRFYKRKDIHYSAFSSDSNLTVLGTYISINPLLYRINLFRTEYINFVRSKIPYPQSEIINALSVGEKSYFPSQLKDRFSALGLSHIFAISGLHIGAVAFAFYFLIKWLLKRSEYLLLKYQVPKIAAFMTISPTIFYAALTGFSISSIRASIMIVVYLIAIIIGKEEFKFNTLGFAGLLILLVNPNSLFHLSFQLSFLSIFGILIFHNYYPFKTSGVKNKLLTVVKTTVAASFITLPLTVNSFGYLPVFTIPANLIILPVVELLIVPLCLLSVITFKLSPYLTNLIMNMDYYFVNLLLLITKSFEKLGFVYLTIPRLGLISAFLIYLFGFLILLQKNYKKVWYILPPVFSFFILINIADFHSFSKAALEAFFLDTERKNIVILKLPDSKKIIFNGGFSLKSRSDFIERSVLIPFLLSEKITSLDLAVYTSLDKSHLKGLNTLTNRIKLNELWINGSKLNSSVWENVYKNDIEIHRINYKENFFRSGSTELIVYSKKANIYDYRSPKPVLIFINFNKKTIVLGESIEHFTLEEINSIENSYKRKIDIVFLPQLKNREKYKRIINTFKPSVLICKKCLNKLDYLSDQINVYDINQVGMVKVEINSDNISIAKYL